MCVCAYTYQVHADDKKQATALFHAYDAQQAEQRQTELQRATLREKVVRNMKGGGGVVSAGVQSAMRKASVAARAS